MRSYFPRLLETINSVNLMPFDRDIDSPSLIGRQSPAGRSATISSCSARRVLKLERSRERSENNKLSIGSEGYQRLH